MVVFSRWVTVAVLLSLAVSTAWAGPAVSVPELVHDFGAILQGDTARHRFVFSNTGDAPLNIEKLSSSCGCTAALASAKVLAPGEHGEIQTSFDSTRFRGDISKTVYLYTNDPARPMVQLQLKAIVQEEVTLEPQLVNFGTVPPKRTVTAKVVLLNQGDHNMRLGKPETTAPELTAGLNAETIPPRGKVTLTLSLTPKPGQARFSGYVLLKADGARGHDLRVPVYADLGERTAALQ